MLSSADYWESRYRDGGTSGDGSEGANASFKARFVNGLVAARDVRSVVEFGCGDGRQLALAEYPRYLGLDVSEAAIALCRSRFAGDPGKEFKLLPRHPVGWDLALSLDVIYHLVEDDVYEEHLRSLFGASSRLVVVYSTDTSGGRAYPGSAPHVRHRPVGEDVAARFAGWRLAEAAVNPAPELGGCDFYVYTRQP